MSNQLYKQFKRSGAYTLFVDESELTRTNVGDTALHVLVGQSRFPSAPFNTLVRIQDTTELYNTFGRRDRFMERKGCFLIPQAEVLLSQGPIFILNVKTLADTQVISAVDVTPVEDAAFASPNKLSTTKLLDIYDKTNFWKIDRTKLPVLDGLLNFATFSHKNVSFIVTAADMSNTEFATATVADYNAANPNAQIETMHAEASMASLFVTVHVFNRNLATDITSGLNTSLTAYLDTPVTTGGVSLTRVLGANDAEANVNINSVIGLQSSGFVETYTGCIIPNVKSSLNDKVSIYDVINSDAKTLGLIAYFNEDVLDDFYNEIQSNIGTAASEYYTALQSSVKKSSLLVSLNGAAQIDSQYVNGTASRQNELLDVVQQRGIKAGLLSYKTNDFAYILDAFKSYVEVSSKWQLAKLAEESKRFAYLYSTPFIKDFAAFDNFQDASGTFDSKYIAQGGNPTAADNANYSMPGPGNGDIATFPFAGGLVYDDGNTQVVIPANVAGAIAYGNKHLSTIRKPYSIVNGPINGVVSMPFIVDVDYAFTDYDLDNLETYGWNMVLKNQGVFEIRNDATAKNIVKSALSNASNYELITYVAREGRTVLEKYVGERNNDITRLRAKSDLDAITNRLIAEGIIERAVNTCDTNNNIAQVRTAGLLLADTELWTADGIRIAVHRIIVKLKTDSTGLNA